MKINFFTLPLVTLYFINSLLRFKKEVSLNAVRPLRIIHCFFTGLDKILTRLSRLPSVKGLVVAVVAVVWPLQVQTLSCFLCPSGSSYAALNPFPCPHDKFQVILSASAHSPESRPWHLSNSHIPANSSVFF